MIKKLLLMISLVMIPAISLNAETTYHRTWFYMDDYQTFSEYDDVDYYIIEIPNELTLDDLMLKRLNLAGVQTTLTSNVTDPQDPNYFLQLQSYIENVLQSPFDPSDVRQFDNNRFTYDNPGDYIDGFIRLHETGGDSNWLLLMVDVYSENGQTFEPVTAGTVIFNLEPITDGSYSAGYTDGYDAGLQENNEQAFNDGFSAGYDDGYTDGQVYYYNQGYDAGFQDGLNEDAFGMGWLLAFFGLFGQIFSIQLLPGLTIGMIVGIPVVFTTFRFFIKMVRG